MELTTALGFVFVIFGTSLLVHLVLSLAATAVDSRPATNVAVYGISVLIHVTLIVVGAALLLEPTVTAIANAWR